MLNMTALLMEISIEKKSISFYIEKNVYICICRQREALSANY